jgi:hypothetical protein
MKRSAPAAPEIVTLEGAVSGIIITPLASRGFGPVISLAIHTASGGGVSCGGVGNALAEACRLLQNGQRVRVIGEHRRGGKGIEPVFWLRWIEAAL